MRLYAAGLMPKNYIEQTTDKTLKDYGRSPIQKVHDFGKELNKDYERVWLINRIIFRITCKTFNWYNALKRFLIK